MAAEFPAILRVTTRGDASGLRVVTDPPEGQPFVMPGAQAFYGSVGVCMDGEGGCVTPDVEGATG